MKKNWTLGDVLDTEFFFSSDDTLIEQGQEADLEQRDRAIFLAKSLDDATPPATEELTQHWLAARRLDHSQPLPGQLWQETTTLTGILLFVFSLLLGLTLTASFLSYDGRTPVNVSGFFAFFILLQLFLLLMQILLFGVRTIGNNGLRSSVLYNLAATGLKNLLIQLYRRSHRHLGASRHLDLAATIGRLRQNRMLYGALFLWPAFILLQIGGIGFNLGVLLTLAYKISFTDIAFGWQSTLPVSEPFLAELIRLLALPWAWLVSGGAAYPGLDQVIGSKIILKDGIRQLTTDNLTAWWPFLVGGVISYGLLPRLLLLGFGRFRLTAKLRQLPFDSAHFRQLRRRMLTPAVQTAADHKIAPSVAEPASQSGQEPHAGPHRTNRKGWLLLIPDELWEPCQPHLIRPYLYQLAADEPLIPMRYGAIAQNHEDFIHRLTDTINQQQLTGILLIQEAWQPPIREITSFLKQLRQLTIPTTPIAVVLLGKPRQNEVITPVSAPNSSVWNKTLKTLGDPYLEVFPLVKTHV